VEQADRADYDALLASANWPSRQGKQGYLDLNVAHSLRLRRDGPPYWGGDRKPI
jgi:hypothetical protein